MPLSLRQQSLIKDNFYYFEFETPFEHNIENCYYGGTVSRASGIATYENRKWILDVIAESVLTTNNYTNKAALQASDDAMVIFDESRHSQNVLFTDAYNLVYLRSA